MEFGNFGSPLLAVVSTIVYCFAGAWLPFVNVEAFIIFLALGPWRPPALVALVALATLSHMTGKVLMYLAASRFDRLPAGWLRSRLASAHAKLDAHRDMGSAVVFTSAVVGLPPFYVVTVASGLLHFGLPRFFVTGLTGRLIRFGVIAAFPQVVRGWLG